MIPLFLVIVSLYLFKIESTSADIKIATTAFFGLVLVPYLFLPPLHGLDKGQKWYDPNRSRRY